MARDWQGIFQKGQGFEKQTLAQLQALEVDVATALATGGVTTVFTRSGAVTAADGDYNGVVASAKTGATAATRYVGATASGAPASGTFAVGDFVVAQNGHIFVCTVAGTPGTWVDVGTGAVSSVFTRTGAVVATSGDYTAAQVTNAADKSSASQQTFTGNVSSPVHIAAGITGATAASRYVGATTSGSPTSGTFAVGDLVVGQDGSLWVCVSAGTPGTWMKVGGQPPMVFNPAFESSTNYGQTAVGSGVLTSMTPNYAQISTGGTASSSFRLSSNVSATPEVDLNYGKNPVFRARVTCLFNAAAQDCRWGMGQAESTTATHVGFRYNGSAIVGSLGNGAAEQTVAVGAPSVTGTHDYMAVMTSGSKVDFYVDGTYQASISTGLPSGFDGTRMWSFYVANNADASNRALRLGFVTLSQDQ